MKKTLEITTKIGCANDCFFCPQSQLRAAYKSDVRLMALDDFCRVLDKLPPDLRIDFSGFTEPFFNSSCAAMISEVRSRGFELHLYTTLMGMRKEDVRVLTDSKPDFVRIHVPDKKGLILADAQWIAQHELWRMTNLPTYYMAMGETTPAVQSYLSGLGVVVDLMPMLSRGGLLWDPGKHKGKIACLMNRWHQNVLLPDGTVVGDCMDYAMTVRLGNLFTQSYSEIFETAEKWRLSDHSNDICSVCEWATSA